MLANAVVYKYRVCRTLPCIRECTPPREDKCACMWARDACDEYEGSSFFLTCRSYLLLTCDEQEEGRDAEENDDERL